jgi:hypothetical protein
VYVSQLQKETCIAMILFLLALTEHYADENRQQESHLQLNHAVEVIGKVQQDLSVRVLSSTDLGPEGSVGKSAHSY